MEVQAMEQRKKKKEGANEEKRWQKTEKVVKTSLKVLQRRAESLYNRQ